MKALSLTVSQLNEYVRRSLAADPMLRVVYLTGEISNFKRHASGHWYFTLKDEEAAINCAMFRQANLSVRFRPENGQRVRVTGSVGLYTKTGSYQFYAEAMAMDGVGDLYLQFEALKRKLAAEGLFDASIKKPIPLLPQGVGIITSKTGAVVHDITRVAWRRYPSIPLYLYPVKVQGEGAAQEIAHALAQVDRLPQIDVIIVGRGGGSMEDLWAFNEEIVARAIASCRTPVISAVGHETDFTIADFVADLRAATPSAAAELAVPEKQTVAGAVELLADRLASVLTAQINRRRLAVNRAQQRLNAVSPAQQREKMRTQLLSLQSRIQMAAQNGVAQRRMTLQQHTPVLHTAAAAAVTQQRRRLENAALRVRMAGPMETMKRGYAIVSREDGVIKSAAAVSAGDVLTIRLADGNVKTVVQQVTHNREDERAWLPEKAPSL